MAKINIKLKNKDKFTKDLQRRFNSFTRSEKEMKGVANIIRSEWKNELAKTQTQKERISSKWAKRRARLAEKNPTSKFYGRLKSNITFTGQLTSRGLKLKSEGMGNFTMYAEGTHKGYNLIRGGKTPSVSMADLAKYLQDDGWRVFFLPKSPKMIDRIVKRFRKYLRRGKQ